MKNLRLEVRITDEEGNYRIPHEPISNTDVMIVRSECYKITEHMYPALAKQHENITYGDVQKALEIIACYCMRSHNNGAILKLDEVERIYEEGTYDNSRICRTSICNKIITLSKRFFRKSL